MPQGLKVIDLSILNQRFLGGGRSPGGQPVGDDSIDCSSHWEGKTQDTKARGGAVTFPPLPAVISTEGPGVAYLLSQNGAVLYTPKVRSVNES